MSQTPVNEDIKTEKQLNSRKRLLPIDALAITESLGLQTFRKELRKSWTKEEDTFLSKVITEKLDNDSKLENIDWEEVAKLVSADGSKKGKDCRKRWNNCLDPGLRKGKWTNEEDEQLINAFEKFGASWLKVAQEIKGRTEDQCAKRYKEILDPKTKGRLKPWSKEEDLALVAQVKTHGTKWRTICTAFESRPSLTCRNRWRKLVTDVVRDKASPEIKQAVEGITSESAVLLDSLSRQQEELTKRNLLIQDPKRDNKRQKMSNFEHQGVSHTSYSNNNHNGYNNNHHINSRGYKRETLAEPSATETRTEWRYELGSKNPRQSSSFTGVIKDRESAELLLNYAQTRNYNVTIHQHIHHHYGQRRRESNTSFNLDDPLQNSNLIEPEQLASRFQHFNYLPPRTEVPKLGSSSPDGSEVHRQHHHHHYYHHVYPHEDGKSQITTQANIDHSPDETILSRVEDDKNSNIDNGNKNNHNHKNTNNNKQMEQDTRPCNVETFRKHDLSKQASSNPLTPLTQAVELLTSAENNQNQNHNHNHNQIHHPHKAHQDHNHNHNQKYNQNRNQNQEPAFMGDEMEGLEMTGGNEPEPHGSDFWETMKDLHKPLSANDALPPSPPPPPPPLSQQNGNIHKPKDDFKAKVRYNTDVSVSGSNFINSNGAISQQFSSETFGQPKVIDATEFHSDQANGGFASQHMDEEDEVLAREVGEVGIDQEILDSYGLFYNVYTKEGSTFPDSQPNQQTSQQQASVGSTYDQWGSGFIIPFNPS